MSKPELYMWSDERRLFLTRHNFYVEQAKTRVLSQFADIEGESERYGHAKYERLCSSASPEEVDHFTLAEMAYRSAQEQYWLLYDLKKQMVLGALAGCYHQWDKDLRCFLERELSNSFEREDVLKIVWNVNGEGLFDILEQFGWNCRQTDFFPHIHACRLLVNVYKHGNGSSLTALKRSYPRFFGTHIEQISSRGDDPLDYECVEVSDSQFDEMTSAIRCFWEHIPERLLYLA